MAVFDIYLRFLIKLIIVMIINRSIRELSKAFKLFSYKAWPSFICQSSANIFSVLQNSKFNFSSTKKKYSEDLLVKPRI